MHERGRTLFTHADVESITRLRAKSARNLMTGLVNRGLATRLVPGLFILVPFELGREREYLGNPYVVARELADTPDYYVSHASAMDLHQMVTQPQLTVFVTSPKAIRPRTVLGTEFRFVRCKPQDMFGIVELWATKTERVRVSDLERTVLDGLKQPEHCGGLTEVAKGFWMRRDAIAVPKLVDDALRLGVGAADLPEDAQVHVYALEEIAVEKHVALTDKARNEPRDLYDLWHLTSEGLVHFATLLPEVEAKLAFRGRTRNAMTAELAAKQARYKKLWAARLGQQMATLPPFDDVFRAVRRSPRDASLVER